MRWLRAEKAWEQWTKAAEERLNRKLQNLFGDVMTKTVEELVRRGIIPSNDANIQSLLYDFRQLKDPFQKIIRDADIEAAGMGRLGAFQDLNRQGIALSFSEFSQSMNQLIENHSFVASAGTMARLTGDVMSNLAESFQKGLGIDEAADRLNTVFQGMRDWELRRVARTEINGFQNMGAYETIKELGANYHQWWTAMDDRVRDQHIPLHGQIVRVGDKFSNGLEYPGDRNGPIEEWINCRCRPIIFIMPLGYIQPGLAYFYEEDLIKVDPDEIDTEPKIDFLGTPDMLTKYGTGISTTFSGFIDGEKYMLKLVEPGSYTIVENPECELLATDIFHEAGFNAPNVRYGMVELPDGMTKMLVSDFIEYGTAYTPDEALDKIHNRELTLNKDQFRTMQIIDVLIGNGDRHGGNFFIDRDGNVIPIDNDLSFVTTSITSPGNTWQQCFNDSMRGLEHCQTPAHIVARNEMGREILEESAPEQYFEASDNIKELITDGFISSHIEKLPASEERKADLVRILSWRRDNLEDLVYSFLRHFGKI